MTAAALVAGRAVCLPWRDLLVLLKLRIAGLIVVVTLASAVASGTADPAALGVLALACLCAAGGAGALNHRVLSTLA